MGCLGFLDRLSRFSRFSGFGKGYRPKLAEWTQHYLTIPKLRTYITFKNDINVFAHISCNLPKCEISLISQLELGILLLKQVDMRILERKRKRERICILCQKNCVENEAHYLLECDLYETERCQSEAEISV